MIPLLVSNLQSLAESNRPNDHDAPRDSGADSPAPRYPRRGREPAGQHISMRLSQVSQTHACALTKNWGNATDGQCSPEYAAQSYQENAAQSYQGNAAQSYQPAQFYQGNAAGSGREKMGMMNHPPWSFIGYFAPWGQWFVPPAPRETSPRNRTMEAPSHTWMKIVSPQTLRGVTCCPLGRVRMRRMHSSC